MHVLYICFHPNRIEFIYDSHERSFLFTPYVYTVLFYLFSIGLVFHCCWSIESWNADPWKTMSRVPEQSQAVRSRSSCDILTTRWICSEERIQPESVVPLRSYNGLQRRGRGPRSAEAALSPPPPLFFYCYAREGQAFTRM